MNIQSAKTQIYTNRAKSIAYTFVFVGLIAYVATLLGKNISYALTWGSFAMIYVVFSFFFGTKMALRFSKAQLMDPQADARYYAMLKRLCAVAGMKEPKLYRTPDKGLNAFATGATQAQASVAFTQGLLDHLSEKELEAVMAHELSHLKHGDTQLMLLVMMLSGILSAMTDMIMRLSFFGGEDSQNSSRFVLFIIGFGISILSFVTQMAISRKREFMADAGAVEMTKNPEAMASALLRLQAGRPMEHAQSAMAPMYINSIQTSKWMQMFSTHPSIEARVEAIRRLIP